MIPTLRPESAREHRRALLGEALLRALPDHRNARQRHQREQRLFQPGHVAAHQEAIDVVVVDEGRHAPRVGMHLHAAPDAIAQLRRGCAAREDRVRRPIEREVEHPRQQRRAVRRAHVGIDAARLHVLERLVDREAFAEDQEVLPTGRLRHVLDAGRLRIVRAQEVREVRGWHVQGRIDAEGVDADLAIQCP
jgi:hypothetical protein